MKRSTRKTMLKMKTTRTELLVPVRTPLPTSMTTKQTSTVPQAFVSAVAAGATAPANRGRSNTKQA